MPNLFPVFETPPVLDVEKERQRKNLFRPSAHFDFELGDFRRDNLLRVQNANGYEAWKQWCIKTIYTERYGCCGYSTDIGIELERALAMEDKRATQEMIQQTITEALLFDPTRRTQAVTNFVFDWKEDYITVDCMIISVNGDKAEISVSLAQGGGIGV